MRKSTLLTFAVMITMPFLLPLSALAYGEQITQAGIQLYSWVRGLGAITLVFGIAGAGFQMAVAHDREGLKKFLYVILGGLLVFLAPSIVNLIVGVSGSAASINTAG